MHKRPSLSEALTLLQVNNQYDVLDEYVQLKKSHGEFFAARFVVDIVDHYNHLMEKAANG
jgi:hypothetical protein|tara:strand:- start:73 stop:252 length:180 start_codon:yes stop_codon:yes gene_type:complete